LLFKYYIIVIGIEEFYIFQSEILCQEITTSIFIIIFILCHYTK